ncbi:hypothetical protein JOF47_001219 [Paeniglutamicibacter kerguelensis]|uniref:Uncharacterized protein n=1 Tax=Paeniglutamicibacter kerguelensis TaxID=254788 RepID=A0ABS4XB67_9MICC|nr:hypothetical protein [Paeniglutamicibacter kerguelensis]
MVPGFGIRREVQPHGSGGLDSMGLDAGLYDASGPATLNLTLMGAEAVFLRT